MTQPPPRGPDRKNDDALSALHNMQNRQEPQEPAPESSGSLSASGFVGMLAKGQVGGDNEPLDPNASDPMPPPAARPIPRPVAPQHDNAADDAGPYAVHEAAEVHTPAPRQPTPQARRPRRRVPGWYKPATPLMFTVGSLLFLVGTWAAAASIAIAVGAEKFPLLTVARDWDTDEPIGFTAGSKAMAFGMLLALPMAIALLGMGTLMARQVMASERQ